MMESFFSVLENSAYKEEALRERYDDVCTHLFLFFTVVASTFFILKERWIKRNQSCREQKVMGDESLLKD